MRNVIHLLIILFSLIKLSYSNIDCGTHRFKNNVSGRCQDCHRDCKECNGTLAGNCLECFHSREERILCKQDDGIYCKSKCQKFPTITTITPATTATHQEIIIEITTPNDKIVIPTFNILQICIFLFCFVSIPFVCFILALVIMYKLIIPRKIREKNSLDAAEIEKIVSEKTCQNDASASLTQNTSETLVPVERIQGNNCQERLEDLVFDANMAIASKFTISTEAFCVEQLDWNNRKFINKGAFGNVFKCIYKDGEKCYHVAVKEQNGNSNVPFIEEQIMNQLKGHPNIIKLITTKLGNNMLLVMPLLKCNLSQYLRNNQKITIAQRIRFCHQIASGMAFIIFRDIVHCDLKAENVLVADESLVQISDFGKSVTRNELFKRRKGVIGTITHTAMELLEPFQRTLNSEATDIWSFGVTIWEIFNETYHIPYADIVRPCDEMNILKFLEAQNHLNTTFWPRKDISPAIGTMESHMKRCLIHVPENRPTFAMLAYWLLTMLPEGLTLTQGSTKNSQRPF